MLGLLAASLAADSSKRCDVKDHLRSAGGLPDDCTALDFQFEQLTPKELTALLDCVPPELSDLCGFQAILSHGTLSPLRI